MVKPLVGSTAQLEQVLVPVVAVDDTVDISDSDASSSSRTHFGADEDTAKTTWEQIQQIPYGADESPYMFPNREAFHSTAERTSGLAARHDTTEKRDLANLKDLIESKSPLRHQKDRDVHDDLLSWRSAAVVPGSLAHARRKV